MQKAGVSKEQSSSKVDNVKYKTRKKIQLKKKEKGKNHYNTQNKDFKAVLYS